jgi:threonine/homoserine/homoserine lactone efflux protein
MTAEQALRSKLGHVIMAVVWFMLLASLAASTGGPIGLILLVIGVGGAAYLVYRRFTTGWTVVDAVRSATDGSRR